MSDIVRRNPLIKSPTPRERAIGEANAAVAEVDHDIIRRAGSPDIAEVPAEYLPARAEARSVDVWDPLWPDDIKRAAIEAAPAVHRHKGTVYAVKRALAALKIDAVVTEWWQTVPRGAPYTFKVTAYARARLYDGPLLDARLIAVAYTAVLRAKPESRAFDFAIGAGFGEPLGLALVMLARVPIRRGVVPRPTTATQAGLGLAPVQVAKVPLRRGVLPLPATDTTAALGLTPVLVARVRLACAVIPAMPT